MSFIQSSRVSAIQGIEVYEETVGTFESVCYITVEACPLSGVP